MGEKKVVNQDTKTQASRKTEQPTSSAGTQQVKKKLTEQSINIFNASGPIKKSPLRDPTVLSSGSQAQSINSKVV